jgi:hypothetical protein
MQAKISFAGEGVKIPGIDIGLSFAGFKIWTGPPFMGFTSATNQALLGFSIIETPVVDLSDLGEPRESLFKQLHTRVVFVKIKPNIFFRDGGIATVSITIREQTGGELEDQTIEFVAENCRGVSATGGDIEFSMQLNQLPQDEWDPFGSVIP